MELGGFPSNYRKKLAQPMLARPLGLELESKLGHRSVREVGVSCALGWYPLLLSLESVR